MPNKIVPPKKNIKQFIKKKFQEKLHYPLNLSTPATYNEKIQWLKLYDRSPLKTLCADKYAVRQYIADKIGDEYLIPLLYQCSNVSNLNNYILPDYPVIIKTNHASGKVYIIKSEADFNIDIINSLIILVLQEDL